MSRQPFLKLVKERVDYFVPHRPDGRANKWLCRFVARAEFKIGRVRVVFRCRDVDLGNEIPFFPLTSFGLDRGFQFARIDRRGVLDGIGKRFQSLFAGLLDDFVPDLGFHRLQVFNPIQ